MRRVCAVVAVLLVAIPVGTGAKPVSLSALCDRSGDDIVVCADPDPPPSRYELPIPLPPEVGSAGSISVSRERNALIEHDGGNGPCSMTGAGGASGCFHKRFKADAEQRANARDKRGRIYDAAEARPR